MQRYGKRFNALKQVLFSFVIFGQTIDSMRFSFILFFQIVCLHLYAQSPDPFTGQYTARFNDDDLTLILQRDPSGDYSGTMKDSYQTYNMALRRSEYNLSGTATESTLGLQFQVTGQLQGQELPLRFTLDFMGETNTMDIAFTKSGTPAGHQPVRTSAESKLSFPTGATHPKDITGTWVKEELYQSGYGDNAMGAGFSQSMTFLPDGRLADGGSSAYMSGSDYSGRSAGQGEGVIPNLGWYAIGQQLYLQSTENGKTENIHLGRYYVENNNMLITGTNGEKILLSRR